MRGPMSLASFARSADQLFGPLITELDLPEEKTEQLKQLLADRQGVLPEMSALAELHEIETAGNDRFAAAVTQLQFEIDQRIRAVLGEADYARYSAYRAALPLRYMIHALDEASRLTGMAPRSEIMDQMARWCLAGGINADQTTTKTAQANQPVSPR